MRTGEALAAPQGGKRKFGHLTNFHVVSGSKTIHHNIPGRDTAEREKLKKDVVTRAVEASLAEVGNPHETDKDPPRSNHPAQ